MKCFQDKSASDCTSTSVVFYLYFEEESLREKHPEMMVPDLTDEENAAFEEFDCERRYMTIAGSKFSEHARLCRRF